MKKMLFSAIAMVAFAGGAFASNELVEFAELNFEDDACVSCPMTIETVDAKGNVISSETKNYRVCTMTCDQAREQVKTFFETGTIVAPSK